MGISREAGNSRFFSTKRFSVVEDRPAAADLLPDDCGVPDRADSLRLEEEQNE